MLLLATIPLAAVAELEAVIPEPHGAGEIVTFLVVRGVAEGVVEACIAVVLVDQDDDTQRKRDLDTATADLVVTRVVAVAVKEFESWLLADAAACDTDSDCASGFCQMMVTFDQCEERPACK